MTIVIKCQNTDRQESIANLINDFQEEYDVIIQWDSWNDYLMRGSGMGESILFVEVMGWEDIPIEDITDFPGSMLGLLYAITHHDGGWDDPW